MGAPIRSKRTTLPVPGAAVAVALLATPALASALEAHGTPPGAPDPAPKGQPARARVTRRRPLGPDECEIGLWHGYLTSKFFARCRTADGDLIVIAESQAFRRVRRGGGEPGPKARAAHEEVLRSLLEDRWLVTETGAAWYQVRLRRATDA